MIAATITGDWSTMPTAVITESSENTMSMTAICRITHEHRSSRACRVDVLRVAVASIASRISITPFTTRNMPPPISTRSRIEMPMPNR